MSLCNNPPLKKICQVGKVCVSSWLVRPTQLEINGRARPLGGTDLCSSFRSKCRVAPRRQEGGGVQRRREEGPLAGVCALPHPQPLVSRSQKH
jgi:hypothetical protein